MGCSVAVEAEEDTIFPRALEVAPVTIPFANPAIVRSTPENWVSNLRDFTSLS